MRPWTAALTAILLASATLAGQPGGAPVELGDLLARVGARVEEYYTRARTVLCTETVRLQPLGFTWSAVGRARRLVYELRVDWNGGDGDAPADASVLRQLVSVDGRAPRADADPDDTCLDPKPVSPEPLEFLLPAHQRDFRFKWSGTDRVDGRLAGKIDYRAATTDPPSVVWHGHCVSVDVPAQQGGRVWVALDNGDVLRLDEHLIGRFDLPVPAHDRLPGAPTWMEIERADSSTRYKAVKFQKPDEVLMLPASIDSLTIVRNAGTPRLRTTQEFSNYRRFVTAGRLVK